MIKLSFLGAMQTVGCSAVLVDTGSEKILMDYGTKIQEIPPKFPLEVGGRVDAILLSHAHLDHSGALPVFFANGDNPPIYSIDVTKPLTELLLLDSIKVSREEGVELPFSKKDVKSTIRNFVNVEYREPFKIGDTEITFFDAGHIPGSSFIYLRNRGKSILYTGDFNTINTRLVKKCDSDLPEVDYLITECTYSDRDHPDRKGQEKELVRIVEETLSQDGVVLLPSFAISRSQEVLLILDKYGIDYPLYMDGMARKATTIINRFNKRLRQPESLDKALEKVEYVKGQSMRKRIIRHPCVIITTSGMLKGGTCVYYLKKLYEKRNCSLVLTGYQVEGTPGRILLETGRYINEKEGLDLDVKMFVKRLDLSSHVGRTELLQFIEKLQPEKIFCIHGDHTEEFALELRERGYDAVAPVANNRDFCL